MTKSLKIGLERLAMQPALSQHWGRCALLSNQASVDKNLRHASVICRDILKDRFTALFSPQHGFFGTVQDNMIETRHSVHAATGLPIFSLYSEVREPTAEMMDRLDTLIIDIQIVGCRVYTFKWTIAACLRAAKRYAKKIVILDRPNPLGGEIVEGLVLEDDAQSFVGEYAIPMRHGLTAGEFARLVNRDIGAELEVVALEYWNPAGLFNQQGREWVMTSPNLPHPDPVYVYPGTVALEGCNISEGRGTALPFQLIGAPFIKSADEYEECITKLMSDDIPGIFLRPVEFMPTYHKGQGQVCQGVQLHILEPAVVRSYRLGLAIIRAAIELNPQKFKWKLPGYEYNFSELPINLIMGSRKVANKFDAADFDVNDEFWSAGLTTYLNSIQSALLYDRQLRF